MKAIIFATAVALGLGAGSAYAGDGDVPAANTFFTELPGVIAQAPVQQQAPSAVAHNRVGGAPTAAFVTNSRGVGTWLRGTGTHEGANS